MTPARRWAACGAAALTGDPDGPSLFPLTTAATEADRLGARFGVGAELLGERAALAGYSRAGTRSAGGGCRLLPARDGWVAVSLVRPEDVALLPACFETELDLPETVPVAETTWTEVAALIAQRPVAEVAGRAELLGLPWSVLGASANAVCRRSGTPGSPADRPPRVVDLTGLWAGPLAASLLGSLGAEVVKVESPTRPDGARNGPPAFFDLLNHGKACVALPLGTAEGRSQLQALVAAADVVLTSSRAPAIARLGLDPQAWLTAGGPRVWVSLTAHGWDRTEVGFGDDAAAGAGLVAWGEDGVPRFAGDAIGDPLAGLWAAASAQEAWEEGGCWFVDASLAGAAAMTRLAASTGVAPLAEEPVVAPVARPVPGAARPLGADTEAILAAWT